jgi:hypothetical protein
MGSFSRDLHFAFIFHLFAFSYLNLYLYFSVYIKNSGNGQTAPHRRFGCLYHHEDRIMVFSRWRCIPTVSESKPAEPQREFAGKRSKERLELKGRRVHRLRGSEVRFISPIKL